jgi:hypothetical protein
MSQRLGRVPIPHAGNGDPQGAAPGSDRLSKGPASVRAVRKHFPGFVWQSLRSGFAILPVRWVTAISSTRARVGVLADQRASIVFSRRGDEAGVDKAFLS